eukprot:scaffold49653_cov31-Tisochrysis_lutea.AAC.1
MARRRQHGPSFGGAWLLAACLCARGSHAEIMRGFGSGSTVPTDADILVKLQALYSEKLKPLEKKSRRVTHPPASCAARSLPLGPARSPRDIWIVWGMWIEARIRNLS